MQFVTVSHLSKMLLKGSSRIIESKDKINKINVFPVADSDTGSNLANTFLGIKQILKTRNFLSIKKFSENILRSVFDNSRGNSGMIMASYLKGFLGSFKGKSKFDFEDFALASKTGEESARNSIDNPVNGTILDVMSAFSDSFLKKKSDSLEEAFYLCAIKVKNSLLQTEQKMKVLKDNHVVDAGALGFAFFISGLYEGLSNKSFAFSGINFKIHQKVKSASFSEFFHEVVFTVKGSNFSKTEVKQMFSSFGESLDILKIEERTKVHIHTDKPEAVKETAMLMGEVEKIIVNKI